MRTLIRNVCLIDPAQGRTIAHGYAVVRDAWIETVAAGDCPEGDEAFSDVVEGRGKLLIPGFVNTHGHAAMSLFRGYADDLALQQWLRDRIWPVEDRLAPDDVYFGAMLAILEMIETGTTTFTDMYFFMDRVAQAVLDSGIRAVLGRGLVGTGEAFSARLAESESLIREYDGAENGRLRMTLAPHALYTCPPDSLRKVVALAHKEDVAIQIHVSETAAEVGDALREFGASPVAVLESNGLFEARVVAAHCVHVTEDDLGILQSHAVHIAHNPGSNLKLGSGVAPLGAMLERGLTVGLGTDGAASNNKLDMYGELRLAALLHKGVQQDATLIPALAALQMATSQGARTLFYGDGLGGLTPGAPADIQLLDISGPRYAPDHNWQGHVVYASHGGDVTDVFVAGKALMRNREFLTIDRERIIHEATRRGRRLAGQGATGRGAV